MASIGTITLSTTARTRSSQTCRMSTRVTNGGSSSSCSSGRPTWRKGRRFQSGLRGFCIACCKTEQTTTNSGVISAPSSNETRSLANRHPSLFGCRFGTTTSQAAKWITKTTSVTALRSFSVSVSVIQIQVQRDIQREELDRGNDPRANRYQQKNVPLGSVYINEVCRNNVVCGGRERRSSICSQSPFRMVSSCPQIYTQSPTSANISEGRVSWGLVPKRSQRMRRK